MICKITEEWQSIYSLSAQTIGAGLLIQNQGAKNVFIVESDTAPQPGELDGVRIEVGEEWIIEQGSKDIFARVSNGSSSVFVEVE